MGYLSNALALLLHHHDRGMLFGLKLLVVVSHRRTLSELGVALQFRDRPLPGQEGQKN
jgi:hypothetical protein